MYVVNVGHSVGLDTIFTSREQSVSNTIYEICRVFMHSIAHIKASHSACTSDRLLQIAIALIIVSIDPPFLYKNHVPSMPHQCNTYLSPKHHGSPQYVGEPDLLNF